MPRTRRPPEPPESYEVQIRSEHVGDRVGERVAVGHRAATRRDSAVEGGSDRATRAAVELHRSTSQLARGARHLSDSSAAAERLSERAATAASEQLAAVANRRQQQLEQEGKRKLRRKLYRQCAERVGDSKDVLHQDKEIAKQLLLSILEERQTRPLTKKEKQIAEAVMQESPEAQRLARTEGKEPARQYTLDVLKQAKYRISEQSKQQAKERDRGMER